MPVPSLDGVRGIAILPVLALHGTYGLIPGGFLGVDLFFVLSGFLITALLCREYGDTGTVNLPKFFARRALRILPPVVVALGLATALGGFHSYRQLAPVLFFYANYASPTLLGPMAHTWSLAVEEQFYLVWPVIFLLCMRYRGLAGATSAALIILVSSFVARAVAEAHGVGVETTYRSSLMRADSLAAGCLAALIPLRPERKRPSWGDAASVIFFCSYLLCIFRVRSEDMTLRYVGFTAFAVGAGYAIRRLVTSDSLGALRQALSMKWIRHIGKMSYGLYIYHLPIFFALERYRVPHSTFNFVVLTTLRLLLTFAFSELSYRFVETPILKLKRRFAISNSSFLNVASPVNTPTTAGTVV